MTLISKDPSILYLKETVQAANLLMKARKADIPVLISSDAHQAEELTLFMPEAAAELQRCGYDHTAWFDVEKGRFVY